MAAVDDLLTCSICLEWFDNPKHLPCGHVYCCKHLQGLVQQINGKLHCPECRKDHEVPDGKVTEFPSDYRIQSFINSEQLKQGKCKQCKLDKDIAKCDHCDNDLCEGCLDEHKLIFTGLIHRLLKDFAREYVKGDIEDIIEEKQREISERHEINDEEQKKINEESDALILAVEIRRETLLLPFARENTILDKQMKEIYQLADYEKKYQEMEYKFMKTDCDMKDLKEFQKKIKEMKNLKDVQIESMKQKAKTPNHVDFDHQRDVYQRKIADFGLFIADFGWKLTDPDDQ